MSIKNKKRTTTSKKVSSNNTNVATKEKVKKLAKKDKSPKEIVEGLHGKINAACKDHLDTQLANGTLLKSKTVLAVLWATFNGFNERTLKDALKQQHTCCPHLYYKNDTDQFVNDATNGKHYACSSFKHYYEKPTPSVTHRKIIHNLLAKYDELVEPMLKVWTSVDKGFKSTGFKAYLEKLEK